MVTAGQERNYMGFVDESECKVAVTHPLPLVTRESLGGCYFRLLGGDGGSRLKSRVNANRKTVSI